LHQNPHLLRKSKVTPEQLIAQDCARKGVTIDHPSIQRECFGRWVKDDQSLILSYEDTKNHFDELPAGNYDYVMGIDLGFIDADAIVVLAYSENSPITYLVHEEVIAKQDLTSLAERVKAAQAKFNVSRSVIDEGGLGKKLAEEMRRRWAIPVEPADKARKMENYSILNDALRGGRFMAKKSSRFATDCMQLEIDREKTRPDKLVVSSSFHSDVIDAALYAFKLSPAYSWEPPVAGGPAKGSREWYLAQAGIDWESERKRLTKEITGRDEGGWPSEDGGFGGQ
jgi:hypothetical protein